jgi:hypothetical protein
LVETGRCLDTILFSHWDGELKAKSMTLSLCHNAAHESKTKELPCQFCIWQHDLSISHDLSNIQAYASCLPLVLYRMIIENHRIGPGVQ